MDDTKKVIGLIKHNNIGLITLDRPPANSYEINFFKLFSEILDNIEGDEDIKVVIIKSASEKFFSAGADIKVFGSNSIEENKAMVIQARSICAKINTSKKIFIAQINGHALGGGLELAMACDLRFAAKGEYLLGLPEVNLGLMPGNGGTVRLVNLIGASKAFELMATGESIKPQQAYELGLFNRLFENSEIEEETILFAQKLSEGPSLAMTNIKRYIIESAGMNLKEALDLEEKLVDPLYDSPDAQEGYKAFTEKRKPKFK